MLAIARHWKHIPADLSVMFCRTFSMPYVFGSRFPKRNHRASGWLHILWRRMQRIPCERLTVSYKSFWAKCHGQAGAMHVFARRLSPLFSRVGGRHARKKQEHLPYKKLASARSHTATNVFSTSTCRGGKTEADGPGSNACIAATTIGKQQSARKNNAVIG